MALSRRIARPLLASIFVVGGWDALWNPAGKAKKAEDVTEPLSDSVGVDQLNAETLVRINGAVQIAGGVLLAAGKYRRIAALALIGSIVPTTYAGHRFWEESDPTTRAQQKIHFLKNLGLLGGLILAAFDTEGEPSLGWRAKRQARELETAIGVGRAGRAVLASVPRQRASSDRKLANKRSGRAGRRPSRRRTSEGGSRLGPRSGARSRRVAPRPRRSSRCGPGFEWHGEPCGPTGSIARHRCRPPSGAARPRCDPSRTRCDRAVPCIRNRTHFGCSVEGA